MTDLPRARAEPLVQSDAEGLTFQARVDPWLIACFGEEIARDREERNHRFLEEALELVQSCGCTASEAHQLVDYVYGRPMGVSIQEIGGVMVTLAALCLAQHLDMHQAGEIELARVWTKVEKIRAKQAAKPKHSPLPEAAEAKLAATPPNASAAEVRLEKLATRLERHHSAHVATIRSYHPPIGSLEHTIETSASHFLNIAKDFRAALAKADAGGRPGPVAGDVWSRLRTEGVRRFGETRETAQLAAFLEGCQFALESSRQTTKPDAGSSGEVNAGGFIAWVTNEPTSAPPQQPKQDGSAS